MSKADQNVSRYQSLEGTKELPKKFVVLSVLNFHFRSVKVGGKIPVTVKRQDGLKFWFYQWFSPPKSTSVFKVKNSKGASMFLLV